MLPNMYSLNVKRMSPPVTYSLLVLFCVLLFSACCRSAGRPLRKDSGSGDDSFSWERITKRGKPTHQPSLDALVGRRKRTSEWSKPTRTEERMGESVAGERKDLHRKVDLREEARSLWQSLQPGRAHVDGRDADRGDVFDGTAQTNMNQSSGNIKNEELRENGNGVEEKKSKTASEKRGSRGVQEEISFAQVSDLYLGGGSDELLSVPVQMSRLNIKFEEEMYFWESIACAERDRDAMMNQYECVPCDFTGYYTMSEGGTECGANENRAAYPPDLPLCNCNVSITPLSSGGEESVLDPQCVGEVYKGKENVRTSMLHHRQ